MKSVKVIRLVQSFVGAVVLAFLMLIPIALGFESYVWILFTPLLLFFALGAKFKLIPGVILCFACGVLWIYGFMTVQSFIKSLTASPVLTELIPNIMLVFLVLTVHENLLRKTPLGIVPAVFLGMAITFYVLFSAATINGLHVIALFCYGMLMTTALMLGSLFVSSLIFGKEAAMAAISADSAKPE